MINQEPTANTASVFPTGEPQYEPVFGVAPENFPSTEEVDRKTKKIVLAMDDSDKEVLNEAQISSQIAMGQEDNVRKTLSTQEDLKAFRAKQEILGQLIKSRQDGRVSPEEYDAVMNLTQKEVNDPSTIVERKVTRKIVDQTLGRDGGDTYNTALEDHPKETDSMVNALEKRAVYSQVAKEVVEEFEGVAKKQGWFGWGVDQAKSMFVPFYSSYKRSSVNTSPQAGAAEKVLAPGSAFAKEIERLYALPTPEEFKKQATESLNKIAIDNPSLAAEMAQEIAHYTISDEYWHNVMNVGDAAIAADYLKVVKGVTIGSRGARALEHTTDTLRGVGKTAAHPNAQIHDVVAATGDVKAAAEAALRANPKALDTAIDVSTPKSSVTKWMDENVPSIASPNSAFPDTPFDTAKGYVRNLTDVLKSNRDLAMKAIFETNFVSRIDKTGAFERASIQQAHNAVDELFGQNARNAVVNTTFVPASGSGVNIDRVFIDFGRANGTLFDTAESAKNYVASSYAVGFQKAGSASVTPKKIGAATVKNVKSPRVDPSALQVVKVGDKYAVRYSKIVDESDPALRQLIHLNDNKTPVSTIKGWLGHISSADANLSKSQNEARSVATSAQGALMSLVKEMAAPIGKLKKSQSAELFTLMDKMAATVKKLPDGNMSRGRFLNSQREFADEFFTMHGKYPTKDQTKAYFVARQLNDLDYLMRNMNLYQFKASRGIEEIKFNIKVPSKDAAGNDVVDKLTVEGMEGKYVDSIPLDHPDPFRFVTVDKDGNSIIRDSNRMTQKEKETLLKQIKDTNSKVIKINEAKSNPLKKYLPNYKDGDPISYAIAPNSRSAPLKMTQVPYNEGGHSIEDVAWRIKSPVMVPTTSGKMFAGESTFSAHTLEGEAKGFHKGLEEARKVLELQVKNKVKRKPVDLGPVEDVLKRNGMPFSAKEFQALFAKDGPLDLNMPTVIARDGQRYGDLVDLKGMNIRSYMDSQHNLAAEVDRSFTAERGLGSMSFKLGGSNNPVWMPNKVRMLDARDTLQRSLGDILKTRVYSDYVAKSANDFISQFGHLLVGGQTKASRAPIFNLLHPTWKSNMDPKELAAAKKMQKAVTLLVYSPSELSKQVTASKDALLNFVYNKFGRDSAEWIEDSAILKTRDPTRFMRSVAFHTQMGLFNPVQLVLNTQTLFHMAAVSPKHAMGAIKDSVMTRWLSANNSEEMVSYLSKKSGYKHFKEMADEMVRSGFTDVNGTSAFLDDALEPKTFTGKFGTFLDTATLFFKESESGLRRTSFSTAYREWREANPTKLIGDKGRGWILNRAKNLNVQMSRESQGLWQHGVWSIPTQFTSYYLRMAEQLTQGLVTGKGALTRGESLSALSMYSMLYGVPTAAGAALGVVPVYDMVKKYAYDNNVDLDANAFTTFLSRGVIHAISEGTGDGKWNYAERWGPGNSAILSDILNGHTSILEAAGGPSGGMLNGIIKTAHPLLYSLANVFNDDPNSDYRLTMSDALEASRSIASINNATRAYMAYNLGLWMTKNGVIQTDVDQGNANTLWASLLGLSPQEAVDSYTVMQVLSDRKDKQKEIINEAKKEWSNYSLAIQSDNEELAKTHLKRMNFLVKAAGVNPNDYADIMRQIIKTHLNQWDELEQKLIDSSRTAEEFRSRLQKKSDSLNNKQTRQ